MVIPPYGADDFMADLDRMTQGRMNRELAQTLVAESNAAVHWMRDVGIKWEPLKEHAKVDGKRYFERGIAIHVAGGGIGQLTQWRQLAEKLGVEIRFESPVCAILGDLRRVEGVSVSGPDGRYDLMAKAVIACAGGFQANPEMRARYLAGNTDMMKVRGSKHDTGEVLRLLLDLGARPLGPMAVGSHVADRRQCARLRDAAARGRPRQYAEPLRLSLRHQRECARLALLRRGRGAALLHLRQDRARGARPSRARAPIRSTIRRASSASATRTTR